MTVSVYEAPNNDYKLKKPDYSVFLAGSIEGNKAERWQDEIVKVLTTRFKKHNKELAILNPRRADYDASWEPKSDQPQFCEQVNWELDGIEAADLVVFYFDKDTKSPITLLELGATTKMKNKKLIVCCPYEYWRSGNVDIVCSRCGVETIREKNDWILEIIDQIDQSL